MLAIIGGVLVAVGILGLALSVDCCVWVVRFEVPRIVETEEPKPSTVEIWRRYFRARWSRA